VSLVRSNLSRVAKYEPGPSGAEAEIDLSENINLWGMPPAVERVLRELPASAVTRYPTLYGARLKQTVAAYVGVTPAEVVVGCGSDDVIDASFRAFGEPGARVGHCEPTFSMVPVFSRLCGLEPTPVAYRQDGSVDVEALLATGARMLYLCTPSNPTGWIVSEKDCEELVRRFEGVLLLDEAYGEFAGASGIPPRRIGDRVLVVRTLSKAFGLAGLRVGYAIGAPPLVAAVERALGPYKVNGVAERAAMAALTDGVEWVRERAQEARQIRGRLEGELRTRGLEPLRSEANFLLVPVPDSEALARGIRARGVAVRYFKQLRGIGDAIRVGVGPWPLMEAFLRALDEVRR
jgi:histidinol-phosphate aminotransferase